MFVMNLERGDRKFFFTIIWISRALFKEEEEKGGGTHHLQVPISNHRHAWPQITYILTSTPLQTLHVHMALDVPRFYSLPLFRCGGKSEHRGAYIQRLED